MKCLYMRLLLLSLMWISSRAQMKQGYPSFMLGLELSEQECFTGSIFIDTGNHVLESSLCEGSSDACTTGCIPLDASSEKTCKCKMSTNAAAERVNNLFNVTVTPSQGSNSSVVTGNSFMFFAEQRYYYGDSWKSYGFRCKLGVPDGIHGNETVYVRGIDVTVDSIAYSDSASFSKLYSCTGQYLYGSSPLNASDIFEQHVKVIKRIRDVSASCYHGLNISLLLSILAAVVAIIV